MNVHHKILRGVSGGLFFSLVSIVVSFVQLRLILDFLPPNMAGLWLLFITVGAYIAFFDLGLSPTLSREIGFALGAAQSDRHQQTKSIADLLATCSRLFRVLSISVFCLAVLLGGYLVWATVPSPNYREVALAWFVFSGGAALNLWASSSFAALYGLGYVGTERLIRSVALLAGLALSVSVLYAGLGIIGLAMAWTVQGGLARLVARRVLRHKYPDLLMVRGTASLRLAKAIVGPSLKWAAMGLGAILILQTDNAVIAAVLGPAAIPQYEAVAKIAITAMSLSLLLATATSPHISKAYAEKNMALVTSLLSRSVRLSVAVVASMAAFVAVFGDMIITLWLGDGRFVGFPVLWTLLLMVLLEAHHVSMATATMATGHIVFAKPALLAGFLNLVISIILAHYLGLWGVALGTLIAQMLTNNWYAPYVTLKHFGVPVGAHVRTVLMPMLALLAGLLTTNILLRQFFHEYGNFIAITISLCLSGLIAAGMVFIWMLTEKEQWIAKTRFAALFGSKI